MGNTLSNTKKGIEEDRSTTLASGTNVEILTNLKGFTMLRNFRNAHLRSNWSMQFWMGNGSVAVSDERIVAYGLHPLPKKNEGLALMRMFDAPWSDPRTSQIHFKLVISKKIVVKVDATLFDAGTSGTLEYHFEIGERAVALCNRIKQLQQTSGAGSNTAQRSAS